MPPRIGTYLEQQILSASPLELIVLSYRTAVQAVGDARRFLAGKDIKQRVHAINLAYGVLGELYRTLDFKSGGDLAKELGRLYEYMMHRLLTANFEQSDPPLAEVLSLLTDLLESWEKLATPSVSPTCGPSAFSPQPWEFVEAGIEQGTYSTSF